MAEFMEGISKLENAKQVEEMVVEEFRQALDSGLRKQDVPEEMVEPAVGYIMMMMEKGYHNKHENMPEGMPDMGDIDLEAISRVMEHIDPEEMEQMARAHISEAAVSVIGDMIGQVPEDALAMLLGRLDEMLSTTERLDDFDIEEAWDVLEPAISPE
jgi:hypothetical protein